MDRGSGSVNANTGTRPIVLTFVHYYLPGYRSGGPVRTIASMVETLGDEFDFRIVTSDRDATQVEPYPHLAGGGGWQEVGKAKVLYLSPLQTNLWNIGRIIRETPHDVLYLNSFFDPVFTTKPLIARRLGLVPKTRSLVAPRGEFSPNALKLKSTKKKAFLRVARASGIYRGLEWQASSEREAADIRRTLGECSVKIAMDLPDHAPVELPPFEPRKSGEPFRIIFLSRISPMKNLDYAVDVLRWVVGPVLLDIYGPVRDEAYWSFCKEKQEKLPLHVEANYRGSLEHDQVLSTLAGYDLFFLPTRGENYGHVILEALSVGTPVLIADTTPWQDLAKVNVGWELPLDGPRLFAEKIEHMARLPPCEQIQMRARAFSFAKERRNDALVVEASRSLFARFHA
jgi:glycosyltransferase involved in cell wall biosynthesis